MKALVLAAGEGTRLRPHTLDRPKPMVEIAGVPAIGYTLRWLRRQGVRDVAINLHRCGVVLQRFLGDGARFGMRITYSPEPELLGTSGALRPLASFFAGESGFAVVYGDVLTDLDLAEVIAAHRAAGAAATMVLTRADDPTRAGIVAFERNGSITRLVEKPAAGEVFSEWANAGVYVCGREVLGYVAQSGAQDFVRELFPAMLAAGHVLRAHPTEALVIDYGAPERLALAERAVAEGRLERWEAALPC